MGEVGEIGSLGLYLLNEMECFLEGDVCRVFIEP